MSIIPKHILLLWFPLIWLISSAIFTVLIFNWDEPFLFYFRGIFTDILVFSSPFVLIFGPIIFFALESDKKRDFKTYLLCGIIFGIIIAGINLRFGKWGEPLAGFVTPILGAIIFWYMVVRKYNEKQK